MRPFQLYKHIRNTDVAMMPVKMHFIAPKNGYKIRCRWFNIVNPNNVFDMHVGDRGTDDVFVKKEDMNNWRPYDVSVQKK